MKRASWRTRVGPSSILVLSALSIAAAAPAVPALAGPPQAEDCAAQSPAGAARSAARPLNPRAAEARARAKLGTRGEMLGRQLDAPVAAGPPLSISLPVESSVARAVGDLVVYTTHTPETGSDVRALNLATGCNTSLATPSGIVRGAVLDPSGSALYVHRVSAIDRADAGVVRHDLDTGQVAQVVTPFVPAEEFGPVFGTELLWSVAGDALAIQSCGFAECVTRVVDTASGRTATYDGHDQGQILGLTRAHLVTFGACHGLPCHVQSTALGSGSTEILAEEALGVTVVPADSSSATVRIETTAGIVELVR